MMWSVTPGRRKKEEERSRNHERTVNFEVGRNFALTTSIRALQAACNTTRRHLDAETVRKECRIIAENAWSAPEYVLPNSVPMIKVGLIGSPESNRKDCLKAFLGSGYVTLEEGLGCRTKLIMNIGNVPHLVVIREECAAPSPDFTFWVEALIIFANNGTTTTEAEAYVKAMKKLRSPSEVFAVIACVKSEEEQLMEFVPRFRCVWPDAPHFEVDLCNNKNVPEIFHVACQGYLNKKLMSRMPATPMFATPGRPGVTPLQTTGEPTPITRQLFDGHPTPARCDVKERGQALISSGQIKAQGTSSSVQPITSTKKTPPNSLTSQYESRCSRSSSTLVPGSVKGLKSALPVVSALKKSEKVATAAAGSSGSSRKGVRFDSSVPTSPDSEKEFQQTQSSSLKRKSVISPLLNEVLKKPKSEKLQPRKVFSKAAETDVKPKSTIKKRGKKCTVQKNLSVVLESDEDDVIIL
ncbi:unnamed protein product [Orchesella dallaii]|uniref:Uncharacterized protein n=1 Tax=Orchesella dallaii TaxID=48710 RepID=A0ABP1R6E3_9HEXA